MGFVPPPWGEDLVQKAVSQSKKKPVTRPGEWGGSASDEVIVSIVLVSIATFTE